VGPATLFPGASTPAKPGEQIALYGSGFGLPASPITNGSASQAGSLATMPVCTVGANQASVASAALAGAGLLQIQLTIPPNTANGDNPVTCTSSRCTTAAGAVRAAQQ